MERLTELFTNDYGFTKPCDDLEHLQLVADKLGQLEDIEDELGIDLVTFVKALKYEIHKIVNRKVEQSSYDVKPMFLQNEWYFIFNEQYGIDDLSYHNELVKVKDFGITWTIKEKL